VLGAQLYTVRDFIKTVDGVAETLEKIADIGYDGVEISALGPVDPVRVADLIEDSGLRVAGTHVAWSRYLNELDEVIGEHKTWGCAHAGVGGLPAEYYSLEGLDRLLKELSPIVKKMALEGIDFSYHNHNHELARYGEKTWLQMLYEKAEPEMLKAEIDVYWIQAGGGDPSDWIRRCAGREPLLHLKDMAVSRGREQRFAEVGEGNLNWKAIIEAAEEGGVEWYIVEQDSCYGRDPFESLAISYRNLKAMKVD